MMSEGGILSPQSGRARVPCALRAVAGSAAWRRWRAC